MARTLAESRGHNQCFSVCGTVGYRRGEAWNLEGLIFRGIIGMTELMAVQTDVVTHGSDTI